MADDVISDEDQTDGSDSKSSFSAGLIKVLIAAIWLGLFAYGAGVLVDLAVFQTGKAQLTNESAYPVYATLLGLSVFLWALLPLAFGFLASKWLGKDAFFAAPVLAAVVFSVGSFIGLGWPNLATLPLWALLAYQAVATLVGVIIGQLVASRRRKKAAA